MPKPTRDNLTSVLPLAPEVSRLTRFLLAALVLLALAGCQGGEEMTGSASPSADASPNSSLQVTQSTRRTVTISPTTGPSPQPTPSPLPIAPESTLGVSADELRGVEIAFWHPWSGAQGQAMQSIVEEFNRTNRWGIAVQSSAYEGFGRLEEAVEAAIVQQTLPQLWVGYNYQARHWDGSRALVDLNTYIRDPLWGLSAEEQGDFYPLFWVQELVTPVGSDEMRRLGVPFYRSAYLVFYNRTWAIELGYDTPPATPFELRVQACAAAQHNAEDGVAGNDGSGGWLITPQPSALVGWLYAFGAEITRPDGQGYQFNTAPAAQALDYLRGLQDSGCAWTAPDSDPALEFASRRALFYAGSLADLPAQRTALEQAGNEDEWTIIGFPAQDGSMVMNTYGPALLVGQGTPEEQLAAWLLVEWLVYPPNQARWASVSGYLPARSSAMGFLDEMLATDAQWAAAVALLPYARSEPSYASWGVMRWALNDAAGQLFDPAFTAGQIPALLETLDQVAEEIFNQAR